jgi:hypothetical protein
LHTPTRPHAYTSLTSSGSFSGPLVSGLFADYLLANHIIVAILPVSTSRR